MIPVSEWEELRTKLIVKMGKPSENPSYAEEIADMFATGYFNIIKNAETILTKQRLIANPATETVGKTAIYNAFLTFFSSSQAIKSPADAAALMPGCYSTLATSISSAISSFWLSSLMNSAYNGFIPGHIALIPPCKVLGGVIVINYSTLGLYDNTEAFVGAFIEGCKSHLLTVSGLHAAVVPPSPAPPYPLPWVGIN